MPRPPPPKAALIMSGKPISLAAFRASISMVNRLFGAGQHGNTNLFGKFARGGLVAHHIEKFGRGPTKAIPPRRRHGQVGVLGQETVAG